MSRDRAKLILELQQIRIERLGFARRSSSSTNAAVATRETFNPAARACAATSSGTVMFTRDMRILNIIFDPE